MKVAETIGNTQLWEQHKTLFLCSKHAPFNCYENVFQWVDDIAQQIRWTPQESLESIVCFNTSELEEEVLKALLVGHVPTILVMTERFADNYNVQIDRALKENRMLIMRLQREDGDGKGLTALMRNKYVINHVQQIVCGPINPNGINYSLLQGRNNVTHLVGDKMPMAAETEPKTHNWTVGEVKRMLRMYYEDMGIHAIHKAINRPYASIYNRIKALAMNDDSIKGREFENYVISLFDIPHNKKIKLKEWRGDKSMPGIYPENNSAPDFVFECKGHRFAVECKWRNRMPRSIDDNLLPSDRRYYFIQYATEQAMPIYLLLGVSGEPSAPAELYLSQLDQTATIARLRNGVVHEGELVNRLCDQAMTGKA